MADKLRAGTKADIIVLTAAIIAKLAAENWVVPASIADIGLVEPAVAVRAGDPIVKVNDAAALRDRCARRMRSSFPIPRHLPPGSTWPKSCSNLASPTRWRPNSRSSPNGATAMRRLGLIRRRQADRLHAVDRNHQHERCHAVGIAASRLRYSRPCIQRRWPLGPFTPKQAQRLIDLLIGADQRELRNARRLSLTIREIADAKSNAYPPEEAQWPLDRHFNNRFSTIDIASAVR